MNTEFSQTLAWRSIIIWSIIQIGIAIIDSTTDVSLFVQLPWLVMLCSYLMMIIYIICCSSYRFKAFNHDLERLKDKELIWCVLLVFMTQYFISLGGYQIILSGLFYYDHTLAVELYEEPLVNFTNEKDLWIACLTLSFIIPMFEELLFRGVILTRLSQRFSIFWSLMLMSLFFGILHGIDFIGATTFGFLSGLLYLKFKNIWAPILVHSLRSLMLMSLFFGILHGIDFIGATTFGFLSGLLYLKFKNIWAPILVHSLNNTLCCLSFVLGQDVHPPLETLNKAYISHQLQEGLILLGVGSLLLYFTLKRLKLRRLE